MPETQIWHRSLHRLLNAVDKNERSTDKHQDFFPFPSSGRHISNVGRFARVSSSWRKFRHENNARGVNNLALISEHKRTFILNTDFFVVDCERDEG